MHKVIIDFETRSECDLGKCGAWKYASDPSTEVICMAFKIDDNPTQIWMNPKFYDLLPPDHDLPTTTVFPFRPLRDRYILEPHGAQFERAIWNKIMIPQFDFPDIPIERWRCSAAKARALALPGKLEKVCKALNLNAQKDENGHRLMKKMCKPRKPLKKEKLEWLKNNTLCEYYNHPISLNYAERNMPTLWHEKPEQILRLAQYCIQDVEAEYELSGALPDLSPDEQDLWFLDRRINERGVPIDVETVNIVLELLEKRENSLLEEIKEITDEEITSPRQRDASLAWLRTQGIKLDDMKKETIENYLK